MSHRARRLSTRKQWNCSWFAAYPNKPSSPRQLSSTLGGWMLEGYSNGLSSKSEMWFCKNNL